MTENYRKTGYSLAVFGTIVVWVLAGIAGIFVPRPSEQQNYPTVSITLAPPESQQQKPLPPVTQKSEDLNPGIRKSEPAQRPVKKTSGPSAAKKQPPAAEHKTVPKKQTADSVKTPRLVKSVEELMEEQQASSASKKSVQWDENLFSDTAEVSSSSHAETSTRTVKQVADSEALSGKAASVSAAAAATSDGNSASVRSAAGSVLSDATRAALGKIRSAVFSRTAGNGVQSTTVVDSAAGGDGSMILRMSDGSPRILIDPAEPGITISEENAKLIDSSIVVTVTFRVLPEGNVPLTGIEITPSSLLPPSLQSEIKQQISLWRFAPDPSEGTARFKYRIEIPD